MSQALEYPIHYDVESYAESCQESPLDKKAAPIRDKEDNHRSCDINQGYGIFLI